MDLANFNYSAETIASGENWLLIEFSLSLFHIRAQDKLLGKNITVHLNAPRLLIEQRRNMHFAKYSSEYLVAAVLVVTLAVCDCRAELTPPYFNLAEGRHISATATCGVGSDGPELYCKLVGANTENDVHHNYSLVQGQVNIVTDFLCVCVWVW